MLLPDLVDAYVPVDMYGQGLTRIYTLHISCPCCKPIRVLLLR